MLELNHTILIQKIPKDGNCRLSTFNKNPKREIRIKDVNHIRQNIWMFRCSLEETVQEL